MPWRTRWVQEPPLRSEVDDGPWHGDGTVDFGQLKVGDVCWYHHKGVPCGDREILDKLHLTAWYWQRNSRRAPLICKLPGDLYFLVDGQCYNQQRGHYDGWTVSGKGHELTVEPSIHFVDRYHGWLRNGVITDDCDGRRFDAHGKRLS